MEYIAVIILGAAVFGLCFLVDKGFTKLFRSQAQHRSGLAVRLNKRYGSFGLILAVLGVAAVFMGINNPGEWILIAGGCLVIVIGIGLTVYYMTFGVFYNEDSFIYTTFGKASKTYFYKDIKAQKLYNNQGHTLIELQLNDGNVIHLQSNMTGVYPFMDHAFEVWCQQNGYKKEDCGFHSPENSCWFPPVED